MLPSPAEVAQSSFFGTVLGDLRPRHVVTALVMLALATALQRALNIAFKRTLERHRARGTLLPEVATRLALARRMLIAGVWVVCAGVALTQFTELRAISAGLLASAGLSGLVVGFAARGTLGNAIAGMTLSIAQPIRIGDDIEFRGDRGVVEDIHLIYTVLRLTDGKRLIVPNETVASEVIKNLTLGGVTRVARVDAKVPLVGNPQLVREAMLAIAHGYESLDREAPAPEVYWVKIDETGTLLRLVATCTDGASSDRLAQKVLARAAQVVHRASL